MTNLLSSQREFYTAKLYINLYTNIYTCPTQKIELLEDSMFLEKQYFFPTGRTEGPYLYFPTGIREGRICLLWLWRRHFPTRKRWDMGISQWEDCNPEIISIIWADRIYIPCLWWGHISRLEKWRVMCISRLRNFYRKITRVRDATIFMFPTRNLSRLDLSSLSLLRTYFPTWKRCYEFVYRLHASWHGRVGLDSPRWRTKSRLDSRSAN